jgi:Domain of unknown function (DUF4432)
MTKPLDRSQNELLKLVGSAEQLAPVTRYMLIEGKGKGVEAVRVETGGGLSFVAIVDRALDLAEARFHGQSLCWQSPAGIVAPAYYERADAGWLRGFGGGMMVTCGLRNVGPGSVEGWETFGLHGEISYTPATRAAARCRWEGNRYLIEVSGEVREAYPFGPHLCLRRTWRTEFGANWIELEDVVTNEGFRPEVHMQLYHWNFGFPLFNPESELRLTTDIMRPRDEAARAGVERFNLGEAPSAGFAEQVFFHRHRDGDPGMGVAALIADRKTQDWGVELSYETSQLPHLAQWKSCSAGEYVLGIEPGNCLVEGRDRRRAEGAAPLEPGESRHFRLKLTVLDSAEAVVESIARLRSAGETVIEAP